VGLGSDGVGADFSGGEDVTVRVVPLKRLNEGKERKRCAGLKVKMCDG
jgi:hypothetical protein